MNSKNKAVKIQKFVDDHKDLRAIELNYQFKNLEFSIDEIIRWASLNGGFGKFIDLRETDSREGVFLFEIDHWNYEVKTYDHGFWGTFGIYNKLESAVRQKLLVMQKAHFLTFKNPEMNCT